VPGPTQLNITLLDGSTVITVPIPPAFAVAQPGLNAADSLLSSIFKRGYFWNGARTTAYSANQIKSVTYT
jgi:hypothetical protein